MYEKNRNEYINLTDIFNDLKSLKSKGIVFIKGENEKKYISYHELYEVSRNILFNLQTNGLKKGDIVILQIDDNEKLIYTFWACILGGIIVAPIDVMNNYENSKKVFRIWNTIEKPHMISDKKTLETIEEYANKSEFSTLTKEIIKKSFLVENLISSINKGEISIPQLDDIAFISFSSGSTGDPKGVTITHRNIVNNVFQTINALEITNNDSILFWMPLTHATGMVVCHLVGIFKQINMYNMSQVLFAQDPGLWIKKISEYKVTIISSPNYGLKHTLENYKLNNYYNNIDLSNVRLLLNASEPVSKELCNSFINEFSEYGLKKNVITPFYGMTESVCMITTPMPEEKVTSIYADPNYMKIGDKVKEVLVDKSNNYSVLVDLGFPLEGSKVRICDNQDNVLGEKTVGCIQIKGDNITKEYYNNKEANKEFFVGEGWLNTGDIGFLRNGRLIVTGRSKDIIFVNGQNFYPGDIERVALENKDIKLGDIIVTSIFNNKLQKDEILAFIVNNKDLKIFSKIRKSIKELINKNMGLVIKEIIPIKEIPRTNSNKVNKLKLIQMYKNNEFNEVLKQLESIDNELYKRINGTEKVSGHLENKLIEIWSNALKIDNISINDSFFSLGGDSITLMRIMGEISKEFGIDITFNDFIRLGSIDGLSSYIKNGKSSSKLYTFSEKNPEPQKINVPFPLTEIQTAYHFGRSEEFELGGISTHFYIELETKLNMRKLNDCLQKVINRHPALRMIIMPDGQQKILESVPEYKIDITDLDNLNSEEQSLYIEKERDRMSHFVFNEQQWPLFEFKAFKLSEDINYMFIGFDLLIADASSIFSIAEEIMDYYREPETKLPELEFSFRDYVLACEEIKDSPLYLESKKYWHDKLEDFPEIIALPLKKNLADITHPYFKRKSQYINKEKWEVLKKLAMKNNLTPTSLVYTAYAQVLSYWSNQQRLAINLTIFNKYPFHKDVDKIIGDFTSVMLVDVDMNSGKTFLENAQNVQKNMMDSLEHRYYDGVDFIRDITKYNNYPANRAVSPVVFTSILFNGTRHGWSEVGEIKYGVSQTSQVYLDNQVIEMEDGVVITWDYIEELFEPDIIDTMFSQYISILKTLIEENEEYKLSVNNKDLNLLLKYNQTKEEIIPKTLQNLFINQAKRTPNNIAITLYDDSITYKELDEMSN